MNISTKQIAYVALFVAIIAVMTLVPQLGLFYTPIVSINIILIPCLIASQTLDLKSSVLVSSFMGVFSMINSFLRPTTVLAPFIQNPLISIFPRIFIGLVAYLVYHGLKKLFAKSDKKILNSTIPSMVGAVCGTLTNTVMFLGMLYLVYGGSTLSTGVALDLTYIMAIVGVNTIAEVLMGAIVTPIVVFAIGKARRAM